jgi:hypothetical protein
MLATESSVTQTMLTDPARKLFEVYSPFVGRKAGSCTAHRVSRRQTENLAEDIEPTGSVRAGTGSPEEVAPCPVPRQAKLGASIVSLAADNSAIRARTNGVNRREPVTAPLEEVAVSSRAHHGAPMPAAQGDTLSLDEDDLSGSGVFDSVDPGVVLLARSINATRCSKEYRQLQSSCWLFGGGFLGGRNTHLKTRLLN